MGRSMRRILAGAVALALVLSLGGFVTASSARTFDETRLTNAAADQRRPAIWGDTIVWLDDRHNVGGADDIYMYDISEQKETRLTQALGDADDPDVYGDIVVWTEDRDGDYDVFMYDISTGMETPITSDNDQQGEAVVYRDTIVWDDDRHNPGGPRDIYRYDILTGTEARVTDEVAANQVDPDIHGRRFAWDDDRHSVGVDDDIYLYDMVAEQELRITNNAVGNDDASVWGDLLAWEHGTGNKNVFLRDLVSGQETQITNHTSDQDDPDVFRDLVAWEDGRHGANEIYLYDATSGTEERVTNAAHSSDNPRIWGNKIAWEDARGHGGTFDDIWMASFELEPDRAGGPTRYETASMVSEKHFATAETVVVATGADFADALSASGLAGVYGGPLLLTPPGILSPAAAAEIQRLGAKSATIVGGEGAVSAGVGGELAALGLTVERIGGADRYETASLIAREIEAMAGATFEQTAFVARGDDFADALAVSPAAYYNRFPILLTRPDALPPATEEALAGLDIETGVVAGGPGAVSDGVQAGVDAALLANGGAASMRWAGPTRYETAVAVARSAAEFHWSSPGYVGIAVGDNFPDALAGGAGAGIEFGTLLLTRTGELPVAAREFLEDNRGAVGWLEALGGSAVVSDEVAGSASGSAQ